MCVILVARPFFNGRLDCVRSFNAFTSAVFVRSVVVGDEVDSKMVIHAAVDPLEEADELYGTVARLAFADDEATLHVEGCDQHRSTFFLYCRFVSIDGDQAVFDQLADCHINRLGVHLSVTFFISTP